MKNMTLEEKFRQRLIDSIARHDLAGTIRAQQDLENLKSTGFNKRVSVKAIVDELDKEDRNRVLRSLNRIPIMADILESLLVDFLDELERIDNTIVMQNITPDVINIKKSASTIVLYSPNFSATSTSLESEIACMDPTFNRHISFVRAIASSHPFSHA